MVSWSGIAGGRGEKRRRPHSEPGHGWGEAAGDLPSSRCLVYGPAMDFRHDLLVQNFDDSPVEQASEDGHLPAIGRSTAWDIYGNVTVDYAIRRSTNTVAVRVLELFNAAGFL